MRGVSESLIAIILIVIGIALAILFISWYLHNGGTVANSLWNTTPNTSSYFGGSS